MVNVQVEPYEYTERNFIASKVYRNGACTQFQNLLSTLIISQYMVYILVTSHTQIYVYGISLVVQRDMRSL